jgi:hypothetical protein
MHLIEAFVVLLFAVVRGEIEILQPTTLRDMVATGDNIAHFIDYSVSLFGEILYDQKFVVRVITPESNNKNGCNTLNRPQSLNATKYVWLLERGACTYSRKAISTQQSGAIAALVYHNDPSASITNILPVGDSACWLIR